MTTKEKLELFKSAAVFVIKKSNSPVTIQKRTQINGSFKWGVFWGINSLNKKGEWELDTHSKTKEFLKRTRWSALKQVNDFLKTKKGRKALKCCK